MTDDFVSLHDGLKCMGGRASVSLDTLFLLKPLKQFLYALVFGKRMIFVDLLGDFSHRCSSAIPKHFKNIKLTISVFNFTFSNGADTHSGLYMIDPRESPKTLDIAVTKGKESGKVYLAIYKFEDGKMIQCMQVSNASRPTEFTGDAGSGNLLEVWEKVQ